MVTDLRLPLGSRCIKYLMFIFNLLFVITGIILISIGVTIRTVYDDYQHLLDDKFFSLPTFLIFLGSIIFFIAFFGCCGAVRENYCMILTFTGLLIVIFIMELSAGIAGYVLRKEVHQVIESKMNSTMQNYNSSKATKELWNALQEDLKCCGIHSGHDWIDAKVPEFPPSCCESEVIIKSNKNCTVETARKEGCLGKLSSSIKAHATELGGAGIGIAFVQAIGIWFAIYLARAIRLSYETV
ncbi:hypothetical protein PV328_008134 [Microctonus aethiopoides]|uniref:Tetraspanin n=1 Tax=Microctonus aethiopoides TaxID=144406 RepID=A0AA39CAC3_9HYME|nr:hypothetical protein PV328_008134 [Microctonus aethiopoides]